MQKPPLWKPLLIVAVLALCGLSLYPPSQRLKPGLDLAGGTTLVYQVDVPADQDPNQAIEQTIAVLRKRVDPNGVRNLIWRRQAGNRIEIQMALPPAETEQRRTDYLHLRQQSLATNIDKHRIDSALRAPEAQRQAALEQLAADVPGRKEQLDKLVQAHERLAKATEPYTHAQDLMRQIEERRRTMGPDAPEPIRKDLDNHAKTLQAELITRTRAYLDARKQFDAAMDAVLATNIDPNELQKVLDLPAGPSDDTASPPPDGATPSPRQEALQKLIARHPDRADMLKAVSAAKTRYDQVRGPLDDPNDLIALLRGAGVLEFRIAAHPQLPDTEAYRSQLRDNGPKSGATRPWRWFQLDDPIGFADTRRDRQALEENPQAYFAARGLVGQRYADKFYLLLANTQDMSITRAQEDWELTNAMPRMDSNGFPAVGFELNRVGGDLMGVLTGANVGKPMAIVLDGRVISAPTVNSRIQDSGIITGGSGGFGREELDYLVRTLNAGTLQGKLSEDPISIKKFGPQIGQDNLHHGLTAAIWALILVAGFMTCYYLVCGLMADFALAANMVIILGVMAMFDATFTLPGIAGIVLTIGMAVDANVLIYERIREELQRGADAATSVRQGYQKALSTIVDANLTTLITCVILNYTATAEIKGFAITLMVGILATMFTALFCTQVIIDGYLHLTGDKKLTSLPAMVPAVNRLLHPNINWVAKRKAFFLISGVLFITGLVVLIERGRDMLDIEFRSGTQVRFQLAQDRTLSLQEVRDRLTQAAQASGLDGLAGDRATVVTVGETQDALANEFSIATLETDADEISHAIKTAFADILDQQQPLAFEGMGLSHQAPTVTGAPVYAVRQPVLGENIRQPNIHQDVSPYLGGVAIVLNNLSPAPTVEELTSRIERMRMQPAYENLGYRSWTVVGMDLAPDTSGDDGGTSGGGGDASNPRYRSAAVLSSDTDTNYAENPDALALPGGLADTEWRLIHAALRRDTSLASVSNFSPQVSHLMQQQASVALFLSLVAVVAYIWVRFGSLRYGLAAIAALVHDVVITLGLVALAGLLFNTSIGQTLMLSDFKINLAMVAAVLTIVGYSLNDTIVVFDRVRENRGRLTTASRGIVNDSINQTISRTVITSLTTLLALLTLYLFGGDGVHGFAYTMLLGVLVGTYSSIAIASPLLLIGQRSTPRKTVDPTPTSTAPSKAV